MRVLRIWLIGLLACLLAQVSRGQWRPFQYWSLNSLSGTTNIIFSTNLVADIGDGILNINPNGRTVVSSAGSLSNALFGYGPGACVGFDTKFGHLPHPEFTIEFSLEAGLTDYRLSYAVSPDRTVVTTWEYSLDGGSYATLATVSYLTTGWQVQTIDLGGIPGLTQATEVSLHASFSAANQGLRDFLIDNIQIEAIPEPPPWACAMVGLLLLGLRMLCRRRPASPKRALFRARAAPRG